ncbi:unnamed protein product, partial [Discosporangium mesarthrocarpum]
KIIDCPLGCGKLILRQWEFRHRALECPKRPTQCPVGCKIDVPADEAKRHILTCGSRLVRQVFRRERTDRF